MWIFIEFTQMQNYAAQNLLQHKPNKVIVSSRYAHLLYSIFSYYPIIMQLEDCLCPTKNTRIPLPRAGSLKQFDETINTQVSCRADVIISRMAVPKLAINLIVKLNKMQPGIQASHHKFYRRKIKGLVRLVPQNNEDIPLDFVLWQMLLSLSASHPS